MSNSQSSLSSICFLIAQITLRISVAAFTLAAIIITITTKEVISFFRISQERKYSNVSALRFQVGANAVVCAFSSLSTILVYILNRPTSHPKNYFQLFLHDWVMTILLISGCAAGHTARNLGKYGQLKSRWHAYCATSQKFCDKIWIGIILSYVALSCMFMLTILVAYKFKPSKARAEVAV